MSDMHLENILAVLQDACTNIYSHYMFKDYFQFIKKGVLDELVESQAMGSYSLISSSAYRVSKIQLLHC